jgi:uncharacterized membrane protein
MSFLAFPAFLAFLAFQARSFLASGVGMETKCEMTVGGGNSTERSPHLGRRH